MAVGEVQEVTNEILPLTIIEKDDELLPLVEKCFEDNVIKNVTYNFKYKTDAADAPVRHFRIIYNPSGKSFQVGSRASYGISRLIAYDATVDDALIDLIASKFNIHFQMAGYNNGQQAFQHFSKISILKRSSEMQ